MSLLPGVGNVLVQYGLVYPRFQTLEGRNVQKDLTRVTQPLLREII